jgi:hypothetical protein
MAALGSQSIASSYEQLLHVDADGGGNTTTHVSVKDGDNGTTFGFTIATDALMMSSTNRLEFGDTGTYIHQSADGVLDLVSDTEIEINATTIDINGAVDVSGDTTVTGNLVIPTAAKGISFTGGHDPDTGGTATANILDDYEEGTFEPTFSSAGSAVYSYGGDTGGSYTKIGRMVYITGNVYISAMTDNSDTGTISVAALPFTSAARDNGDNADDVINCYAGLNWDANKFPDKGIMARESTTFALTYSSASGAVPASTIVTDLHATNDARVYFSGVYRTD